MKWVVISLASLFAASGVMNAGVAAFAGLGTGSSGRQEQASIEELRTEAEWHVASLSCLSVSFSFDMAEGNTPSLFERSRSEVDLCYEKVRWDHHFGKKEGAVFHRAVAFDGTNSVLQEHDRKHLSLHAGKLSELRLSGLGFFDLNMLVPSSTDPTDENDVSLAGMLAMSTVELREGTELVGDRACFVVDRRAPLTGSLTASVWIDAERAGVPMRQQYFVPGATVPIVEFEATKVAEVSAGLWVVVEGKKVARVSWGGNPKEFVTNFKVESDDKGALLLKIDPDLPASVFSPAVPADYVHSDHITGKVTRPKK